MRVCISSHLWSFGLVLPVEKLRQGSSLNLMDASRKEIKVSVLPSMILNDEIGHITTHFTVVEKVQSSQTYKSHLTAIIVTGEFLLNAPLTVNKTQLSDLNKKRFQLI